jgi:hypothetical protein
LRLVNVDVDATGPHALQRLGDALDTSTPPAPMLSSAWAMLSMKASLSV